MVDSPWLKFFNTFFDFKLASASEDSTFNHCIDKSQLNSPIEKSQSFSAMPFLVTAVVVHYIIAKNIYIKQAKQQKKCKVQKIANKSSKTSNELEI